MTLWAADFSAAQLNAGQLKAAGYCGAVRYITGAGKQITDAEFHDLTETPGMALALVNETYAQAAGGGYAVGRAEAEAAFTRADTLGWPADRPIYFVLEDPHYVSPPWQVLEEYLHGVLTVAPVSRVGDYGSAQQINHMMSIGLATYGWAVETWPGDESHCHLQQRYNPYPGAPHNFGGQVDPDMILQPDWGQWSAVTPTPKAAFLTAGQEAHMIVIPHPTSARRDYLWSDATYKLWHAWTDPGDTGQTFTGTEDLAGFGYTVSGCWTAAGLFVVVTDGVDGLGYERVSDGAKWLTGWVPVRGVLPHPPAAGPRGLTGPAGPAGLAGHDGLAGPQGLPGAGYDDSWRAAAADAIRPKAG